MNTNHLNIGLLDNRFLARSVGLLSPAAPICVREDATIQDAITMLWDNHSGCLLVTNDAGTVCGIFTERDVVRRVSLQPVELHEAIATVMTPTPQTIGMTTPIAYALQLMSLGGYRHLPVVDEDNFPLGTLSVQDIVDYIVHSILRDLAVHSE